MKREKQDRRSQRTRHLVNSALTELLREKRYHAITVQDLLDRAGIGRSTFYTHYFDKEDVLASVVEEQLHALSAHLSHRNAEQRIVPSLALFEHIQENSSFFQAMVRGQTGEVLWKTGQALLSRNIEQALIGMGAENDSLSIPLMVVAQYLAGAFVHLLAWWLETDMPYSPEQMDRIFQQLALPGVWAAIGHEPREETPSSPRRSW